MSTAFKGMGEGCDNSQKHQKRKNLLLVKEDEKLCPFSLMLTPFKCCSTVDHKQISYNTFQIYDGTNKMPNMNYYYYFFIAQNISFLNFCLSAEQWECESP